MNKPTQDKEQETLENGQDLLNEYKAQTEDDDIHFEHYDWSYNDGSGCCC